MIDLEKIPEISGIYKFTNTIKNKVYIGQAVNLRRRISTHLYNYTYSDKNYFYKSIKKYKIENFEVEILIQGNFNENELNEMEITFIRLFKSNNSIFGYNLTAGGGGSNGIKQSLQTILKRVKHYTGKKQPLEVIEKRRLKLIGRKHSEETKEKIRQVNLGKKLSKETVEKMKNTKKLNPFKHSEESKQKMSKSGKGKKHSEETKQKIKDFNLDKKRSEETKAKMSKSAKGKPKSKESIQKRTETRKQKGFKHSQETIQKMKNFKHSEETKEKLRKINSGRKHSPQHIEKVIKTRKLNKAQKILQENCCYEEYFYNDFVYQS